MNDFTIILRSLSARLFSTVTTVITVAVAVGLMLTLLSMRDASRRAFDRGPGNMDILISRDSSPLVSVLNGVFYARAPASPIRLDEYEALVQRLGARIDFAVPTQLGDSYRGLPVMATTREFFERFQPSLEAPWKLREGAVFSNPFEVVLGSAAAKATLLRIGDTIHLTHGMAGDPSAHEHYEYDYKVVGVLEPTGGSHDRAIFTDLRSAWIIHAHDRRTGADSGATRTTEADLTDADRLITGVYAKAFTRPGSSASAVMPSVLAELRRDPSITVAQPAREIERLFTIVGSIDQLILGIAAVVLVSSGIAIMLALYNSMEQRRRQIAVLRVLGASRGRIFGLVLTESAVLGALGAGAGFLLFVVGSRIVASALKERLGLVVQPVITPDWLLGVIAGTIVLASAAGIVPAVMAYRTSVARSLRPVG